jgi:amidase
LGNSASVLHNDLDLSEDEAMSTWVTRLPADGDGPRLAVKDCIDVEGVATTVGCPVIAERSVPAGTDAAVVASARKSGARIAGKTGLTELCWSATGVNSWLGTPRNPADPRCVPGGSSSGSAVAVAAGEADVAFGTDTGGSVRIPAACCGVAGLKTTWGRVSLQGVYPLAPSLDTVGPLGANLAAVELGMRLIEPGFTASLDGVPLAAGRLRPSGVDPAIDKAVDLALAAAGIDVTEVACCEFRLAVEAAGVIIDAEGYRANTYLIPYLERLSNHVQRNMTHGASISRADLAIAERVRESVRRTFGVLLADHPLLVMPTLIGPPPLLGERGFGLTVLTAPVNLAGLPALALPIQVPADGRSPASLQVIGPAGSEERLIAFGRVVEAAVANA